jgi:hypothetical protein
MVGVSGERKFSYRESLFSPKRAQARAPRETLAQHLQHIMTLFAYGIEVVANRATALRNLEGAKAAGEIPPHHNLRLKAAHRLQRFFEQG